MSRRDPWLWLTPGRVSEEARPFRFCLERVDAVEQTSRDFIRACSIDFGAALRCAYSIDPVFAHEEEERPEEEREDVLAARATGMCERLRDCPAGDNRTEHDRRVAAAIPSATITADGPVSRSWSW